MQAEIKSLRQENLRLKQFKASSGTSDPTQKKGDIQPFLTPQSFKQHSKKRVEAPSLRNLYSNTLTLRAGNQQ